MPANQQEKVLLLQELHNNDKILVLPNIWDPLGALMLEELSFPAIATASAAIAYSNGYADGENIPFTDLIKILARIVGVVKVPVTADIESGYAADLIELAENIKALIDTGVAGINIEDSRHGDHSLISIEEQSDRIAIIKQTAADMGTGIFINARTDIFIRGTAQADSEKLEQALLRASAYRLAGADCFYPITLKNKEHIEILAKQVSMPVNILMIPGVPGFKELQQIGVSRLSLGPGFLKIALGSMKNLAEKLLHEEGMDEVTGNQLSSVYLQDLVTNG